MPFGNCEEAAPHLEAQIPHAYFWGVNRRFQVKRAKYYNLHIIQIIASIPTKFCTTIKDHQVPFVGGPNMDITKPIWRMAAILKKNC